MCVPVGVWVAPAATMAGEETSGLASCTLQGSPSSKRSTSSFANGILHYLIRVNHIPC